ncbi:MAG: glutamine amidotransferase-related protein [Thomasclavelia sp.]
MSNLKKYDLIDVLNQKKDAGTPILGICLGMQILLKKVMKLRKLKD